MMDREPDLSWPPDYDEVDDDISEMAHDEEWEDLTSSITAFMQKVHPDGGWRAEVAGFGWQSLNGYLDFDAGDGKKLLQKVLPDTENTFKVWLDEEAKTITINNAHHDKPTGGEIYTIKPQEVEDGDSCEEKDEGDDRHQEVS